MSNPNQDPKQAIINFTDDTMELLDLFGASEMSDAEKIVKLARMHKALRIKARQEATILTPAIMKLPQGTPLERIVETVIYALYTSLPIPTGMLIGLRAMKEQKHEEPKNQ